MYAVIKTGGKQYRVEPDDVIKIERLDNEAGSDVTFDQVLLVGEEGNATVGAPTVDGASVVGTVLEQARGRKIIVFKKKRRKNYRRKAGHRQDLTVVRITDIVGADGKRASASAKAEPKPAEAEPAAADETPATTRAEET
jgi:large subunit ribosomal protein L21